MANEGINEGLWCSSETETSFQRNMLAGFFATYLF